MASVPGRQHLDKLLASQKNSGLSKESSRSSGDSKDKVDHKDRTRKLILAVYEQYGISAAFEKARAILKQCEDTKYPVAKRSAIKGELAEVVLEVFCAHLQKILPQCIISKGLCIYKQGDKRVTTEMDLVLFTPFCTYMFECKSYSGKKTLTDKCFLKSRSSKDVYGQSRMHLDILWPYISPYMVKLPKYPAGNPPVQMILFELSSGDIDDQREPRYKELFPCLTLDTLLDWAQKEFGRKRVVLYDLARMEPVLRKLDAESAEVFKKHLARLKKD